MNLELWHHPNSRLEAEYPEAGLVTVNHLGLILITIVTSNYALGFTGLLEIDCARTWPCKNGQIPKTLRFDPNTSCTSFPIANFVF